MSFFQSPTRFLAGVFSNILIVLSRNLSVPLPDEVFRLPQPFPSRNFQFDSNYSFQVLVFVVLLFSSICSLTVKLQLCTWKKMCGLNCNFIFAVTSVPTHMGFFLSPNLTSPCLASPHLLSPLFTSSHLFSLHLFSPLFTSPLFTSSRFATFHLFSPLLTSPLFTSSHLFSLHLFSPLFTSSHFTSPHLTSFDLTSLHLTSSLIILMLIIAYPPGHNFGSEHDPDTTECAPAESDGGKFIMYPASVSGQWANNKVNTVQFEHLSTVKALTNLVTQYCNKTGAIPQIDCHLFVRLLKQFTSTGWYSLLQDNSVKKVKVKKQTG